MQMRLENKLFNNLKWTFKEQNKARIISINGILVSFEEKIKRLV